MVDGAATISDANGEPSLVVGIGFKGASPLGGSVTGAMYVALTF
jgi:hypothetical protein